MNEQDYLNNETFKTLRIRVLTPSEKADFKSRLLIYQRENLILENLRKQVSALEARTENDLPSLPGAEKIHEKEANGCGFKTAFKLDSGAKEEVYYCPICNKYFQPSSAAGLRFSVI